MTPRIELARHYFCAQTAVQQARRGEVEFEADDIAEIIGLHNALMATNSRALKKAAMKLPVVVAVPGGAQ